MDVEGVDTVRLGLEQVRIHGQAVFEQVVIPDVGKLEAAVNVGLAGLG